MRLPKVWLCLGFRFSLQSRFSAENHYNIQLCQGSDQLPLVGAHEGLSGDFGKNSPPAWRLVLGVWISMLKTLPDISDVKDFRCVSKGERIFPEATGEKEFQVQEASWTLLGLQGWLREMQNIRVHGCC